MWVKRLFISRQYQNGEKAEDYTFIHATVDDNPQLLEASPEYVQMLDLLPDDVRAAWRYGDWDALAGTFFPEFRAGELILSTVLEDSGGVEEVPGVRLWPGYVRLPLDCC